MSLEHDIESPLAEAVRIAGSQSAFGRIVGRAQSSVRTRLISGQPCWPEDVLKVEKATGVSRHDLRPDLYPRDDTPAPAPADPLERAA